jgi:surfeit locus 1 family protein
MCVTKVATRCEAPVARWQQSHGLTVLRTFSSSAPTGAERVGRRGWSEHVFFGLPIAVTFSLGAWQVYRLDRKRKLIAVREEYLAQKPLDEESMTLQTATDSVPEFSRVILSGKFLHEREMLVGPRSPPMDVSSAVLQWGGSSGFQVVTPFITDSGRTMLVIRGWIPQRLADPRSRADAAVAPGRRGGASEAVNPTGEAGARQYLTSDDNVSLTAVVKASCEERGRFTPDNQPSTGDWYYVDASKMATSAGLTSGRGESDGPETVTTSSSVGNVPVVELLRPAPMEGWPHPRPESDYVTFRTPPSTHVVYATTWFSLSAALALLTRNRYRLQAVASFNR